FHAFFRWGQAHAIIQETLWVYGGKTDRYNQFSYTSAPNTNDLFRLDLSQSFDLSNPPWHIQGGCGNNANCQGPLMAFHSLAAYDPAHMLMFGGQPDPNSNIVLPDRPDSAWTLDVENRDNPSWLNEPKGWANEPSRRIFHSASSSGGKVFITGGQKADGSQIALSQHEVYDYKGPTFTTLPTADGPPDLYGHTSLVLRNGSLLVFGGYSQSQGTLLPFSTIWILDTWADTFTWSLAHVDNTTLPPARRNFAAVVLSDDRILIHGGSDAVLQTTYSDGWILDTTKDPMVWSHVYQLSALGARRDHMAVAMGSVVIFAFGYGPSGPAPTPVIVYDTLSGTWPPTYAPPSSTPINTFVPTPTSQSNGVPPSTRTSSNTKIPIPTKSGHGGAPTSSSHITGIIIGVILGALALVVVSIVTLVVAQRRRPRNDRFHMIYPSEDDENPHAAAAIPVAQSATAQHRVPFFGFGIIGSRNPPLRRDMLADEDTRHFNDHSHMRDASGTSSYMEKSIRAPSNGSSFQDSRNSPIREKDPFSDQTAFIPSHEGIAPRPKGGSIESSEWSLLASQTHHDYRDPFEDDEVGHYQDGDADAHSLRSGELDLDHTLNENPPQSLLSQRYLGNNLQTTVNDVAMGALPTGEVMANPGTNPSWSLSNSSGHDYDSPARHGQPSPPIPTKLSLIDANPTPYQPLRRSDSWWSRFAKSAFLDRRSSDASSHGVGGSFSGKPSTGSLVSEFRDPNPAPKLVAIEESSPESLRDPSRQGSGDSKLPDNHLHYEDDGSQEAKLKRSATTSHERVFSNTAHGKSISSLQTTNTEALERIGGMDIVQREVTESSTNSWGAGEEPIRIVTSSTEFGARHHENDGSLNARIVMPTKPPIATRRKTPSGGGGIVASRIKAFENMESKRETVKYGLAPRQSLFVANPDSKKTGSLDPA
ncbi:hypothetical protein BDM02DRAFT_3097215, partial [Thelephora ganbajun]